MGGSLSQKAKEDLWIVGLLQLWQITLRRWNKSRLKCHYDSNFYVIEIKQKKELESKVIFAQQEVLDLHNQIHATKEENRKTFQVKERELNKLQMKLLMANQRKGTLEQQMQSYEIIREKKDMLKLNQEREDARHQVLTKKLDDLEMKSSILQ